MKAIDLAKEILCMSEEDQQREVKVDNSSYYEETVNEGVNPEVDRGKVVIAKVVTEYS